MERLKYFLMILCSVPHFVEAQNDSNMSWQTLYPTKPFKLLGYYWQRNGHNVIFGLGDVNITGKNTPVNQFIATSPSTPLKAVRESDEREGMILRYSNQEPSKCAEIGYAMSYELVRQKNEIFNKEVRIGFYYSLMQVFYVEEDFSLPSLPGTSENKVRYIYERSSSGFSTKADLLWNTQPLFKRIAFYGGGGLNLGSPFFNRFKVTRQSQMVVNSSGAFVSRDSFEIFYDPVKNGFPFSYGINGIVGIKYNAGCYTNWFAEFSPTLQAISYFPGGNLYYSWMVRIGLRFKLNVYDLVPNKDGKAPSPFY